MDKISPLAPSTYPVLPAIDGVQIATYESGMKYQNRDDITLAVMAEGTQVAGVFTKSKTCSSNITWGREILSHGKARVLIVNAGNANAFNGKCGEDSIERIVAACAEKISCEKNEVYPSSTGVIGEPLDDNLITNCLDEMKSSLSNDGWEAAAKAIRTTDTYHKVATETAIIDGKTVTLNGIAKGSGMIAPDMATMLSYIFTDANIPANILQEMLSELVETSFNSITVDSDTSTSDTLLLFATCKSSHAEINDGNKSEKLADFKRALNNIMLNLAHQIVKDGEGATKFITINVKGAESDRAAKIIGLAIADSPLVKTAIAGEDPNWGRIVMAVGKSGEQADRDKLTIGIGEAILAKNGQLNPDYTESATAEYMKGQNIDIHVDLAIGNGQNTVWTCDLTHDYISINADYRS